MGGWEATSEVLLPKLAVVRHAGQSCLPLHQCLQMGKGWSEEAFGEVGALTLQGGGRGHELLQWCPPPGLSRLVHLLPLAVH